MTDTILTQIQNIIDSRKGGDPDASYVAQLLHKGEDKILKKVIEEAGETLMASKDGGGEHFGLRSGGFVVSYHGFIGASRIACRRCGQRACAPSRFVGISRKSFSQRILNLYYNPVFDLFQNPSLGAKTISFFDSPVFKRPLEPLWIIVFSVKIATKDIPAQTVYEDDEMLCFKDIRPAAPVHLLLIPKVHFDSLAHATAEHQILLGKMMLKVPQIAHEAGLTDGFKTLINTGKGGGQEVFHLHIHIMGTPA